MINYKTNEEIELMRQSCLLVGDAIAEIAKLIKPGVTTLQLEYSCRRIYKRAMGLFLLLKIIMDFLMHVAYR